jgi:hypothetical protein
MNVRAYFITLASVLCIVSNGIVHAKTGACHDARTVIENKSWDAIRYKYSPQYIEDNKAEFEKAITKGGEVFFNDCQTKNLSDEQILLQGALDFAALPIKIVADDFLKKIGLPPLGDKAFHIDVKDIENNGIWGGPNSFFRKPFG